MKAGKFLLGLSRGTSATGEQVYSTPGTTNFTVPEGVTSISAVCIGAGGGGSNTPMSIGVSVDGGITQAFRTYVPWRWDISSADPTLVFTPSGSGAAGYVPLDGQMTTFTPRGGHFANGNAVAVVLTSGGATTNATVPAGLRLGGRTRGLLTINVTNGGSGYTFSPQVTVNSFSGTETNAVIVANVFGGAVVSFTVFSVGSYFCYDEFGYPSITITITGGGGSGAYGFPGSYTDPLSWQCITDSIPTFTGGHGYTGVPIIGLLPGSNTIIQNPSIDIRVRKIWEYAPNFSYYAVITNGGTFGSTPSVSFTGGTFDASYSSDTDYSLTAVGEWGTTNYYKYGYAGAGGGLSYKNAILVAPGQNISVTVGGSAINTNGGTTSFGSVFSATGGTKGSATTVTGGAGAGGDANWQGGTGAAGSTSYPNFLGGGGGGAAGYTGDGGAGSSSGNGASAAATGGGGGGGKTTLIYSSGTTIVGSSGGGTSLRNFNSRGAGGVAETSGGQASELGTYDTTDGTIGGVGGRFGGGGAGNQPGGAGAIRIIWGPGRSFPTGT